LKQKSMRRRFFTLDVFTDQRFTGNPLAVVLDPDELDSDVMQTIAREFGHPETVFVLPPTDRANRARLRIFTPARELAFAGHPTVGTAVLLGQLDGGCGPRAIVLEEGIGPVRCRVEAIDDVRGQAEFDIPQLPSETAAPPDNAAIAAALGLDAGDIGFGPFRAARWSAGNAFLFVPVRGLEAIRRCRPDPARINLLGDPIYVFCGATLGASHDYHARMFAPQLGVPEDPATGSAAAAFAGVIAKLAMPADGEHAVTIVQGYEMGRPSRIRVGIVMAGGTLQSAKVGGDAVVVTEGTIEA
jgi:trans-2,3-dihydro-3-hydroxyanthranilate isomerase